ncbi:transcription factor HES-2-like [Thunnus thynnus]|uniref:transcription factor HES-2-like n=1 Tax=Thunnus maccoyii TaxID=8240 RepID=UPI001C4DBB95|nr:transcription factor HES-2-like [Thunnus maccoyii]
MVILLNVMLFCCFHRIRGQSNRFVLAWGRTRDARRPTPWTWIYTVAHGSLTHIFVDICFGYFSGTKTTLKMSPNMTCEALQSFSPRLSVAKRKEALELRKTMKPLMEKRRRARINDSLNHLKNLILPLTGRDKTRYSKLEKADILEMTVRFLSDIPPVNTKNSTDSYKEGYKACLQRVSALLPKTSLDQDACQRVNDFVQRSMSATVTPSCMNCCAQNSKTFPQIQQIQQRLFSLKSSFSSRLESQSRSSSGAVAPGRAHPGPQAVSAAMWRPW